MKVLRTPDSQFADLPDYDFTPNYTSVTDADGTVLRMHSVDVGPRDADPISRGFEKELQAHIPGCAQQDHKILQGVGHFSPEEVPEELAALLLEFIRATEGRSQTALAENGASAHQQSLERA